MSRFVELPVFIRRNSFPVIDRWDTQANVTDSASHVVAIYKNGNIYRCSGAVNLLEYDIASGMYASKNAPGAGMGGMCGIAESRGHIYYFGGYNGNILNLYKYFDINTSTWSQSYTMPFSRMQFPAATALNGYIYLFGGVYTGTSSTDAIFEFNPFIATFTQKTNLPIASRFMCAACMGDYIYLAGGQTGASGALNGFYRYNTISDIVETMPNIPVAVRGATLTTIGKKLYLMGGYNASGATTTDNYEYDISKNIWTKKASLPTARGDHGACVVESERSIHILNGYNGGNINRHDVYLL